MSKMPIKSVAQKKLEEALKRMDETGKLKKKKAKNVHKHTSKSNKH